jgi:hypothetical protein
MFVANNCHDDFGVIPNVRVRQKDGFTGTAPSPKEPPKEN